jgi:hypothetical protein
MPIQDFAQYGGGIALAPPQTENAMGFTGQPLQPANIPQFNSQQLPPYAGQFAPGMQSLPIDSVGNRSTMESRVPNGPGISTEDITRTLSADNALASTTGTWSSGSGDAPMQTGQMLDDNDASWDDILKMQASMIEAGGKKWEAVQLITYHMEKWVTRVYT